jgi:FdhD protein
MNANASPSASRHDKKSPHRFIVREPAARIRFSSPMNLSARPTPIASPPVPAAPETLFPASTLHWSSRDGLHSVSDQVVVESPLSIEIVYDKNGYTTRRLLGVTMRTPGHDHELALGLLRAEGLIASINDVRRTFPEQKNSRGEAMPTWCVELVQAPPGSFQATSRTLVTTSACGFCGRDGQESLPVRSVLRAVNAPRVTCAMIASLPEKLHREQSTFFATGGCHGAAIADQSGSILLTREDVGRHNAVDKLLGASLLQGLTLENKFLILSGRASFELIQKASVGGFGIVAAVGAPSSAAVELANATGITLIGFVRDQRFNVYTHVDRLELG